MKYWQIAAGSGTDSRDYSDEFLRFGIAFAGDDGQSNPICQVQPGERMVLKRGISRIIAAGEVVQRDGKHSGFDDKDWLHDFDGWHLPGWCYVDWHVPPQEVPVSGLRMGTISAINQLNVIAEANRIIAQYPVRNFDKEPESTTRVEDEEIIEFLIENGMAVRVAEDLTRTFGRIRRLEKFYRGCPWEKIREHETRTFLVVPLLLALGWPEQKIKIELTLSGCGRADVALFNDASSAANEQLDNLCGLIETKGFKEGLFDAPKQALNYASDLPNCKVVFVSNGYCYKAYVRQPGGMFSSDRPSAYLNIREPRNRYPRDPAVDGCLRAIELLLPP